MPTSVSQLGPAMAPSAASALSPSAEEAAGGALHTHPCIMQNMDMSTEIQKSALFASALSPSAEKAAGEPLQTYLQHMTACEAPRCCYCEGQMDTVCCLLPK